MIFFPYLLPQSLLSDIDVHILLLHFVLFCTLFFWDTYALCTRCSCVPHGHDWRSGRWTPGWTMLQPVCHQDYFFVVLSAAWWVTVSVNGGWQLVCFTIDVRKSQEEVRWGSILLSSTTYSLPNRIFRFLFQVICLGVCLEGCHLVMGHARSYLFIYFVLFYFILSYFIYLFILLVFKNNQCILL